MSPLSQNDITFGNLSILPNNKLPILPSRKITLFQVLLHILFVSNIHSPLSLSSHHKK